MDLHIVPPLAADGTGDTPSVPERERIVWENPELRAGLLRGLDEVAANEAQPLEWVTSDVDLTDDGTADTPPMPSEVELARSSFRCLQGGAADEPKRQPIMKPNAKTRVYQLRNRLFQAYGEAPEAMIPLIDELMSIADGEYPPDPEAA